MKPIIIVILTLRLVMLSNFIEAQQKSLTNLKGKVYSTSFGMDSTKCETIEKGTDFFETLMFINDSVFLHGFYTCCPGENEESPTSKYNTGMYKLDESLLTLFYFPLEIVILEREVFNDTTKKYIISSRIVTEIIPVAKIKCPRYNCNNIPYFKNPFLDLNEFFTPDNDVDILTLKYHLKSIGIWEKLFNDKNKLFKKIINENI